MDYAALINDVFSYRKEIEFEGELHNAVLVVRNFLSVDTDRAFADRGRPDDLADEASSSTCWPRSCRRCSRTSGWTRRGRRRCRRT